MQPYPRKHFAQEMKFSVEHFFNQWEQIRSLLRIYLHLLKNSLRINFLRSDTQQQVCQLVVNYILNI